MDKNLVVFAGIIAILISSSCTKILDDELPEKDPKLVINGVISPDSILKINVSKTFHIFENESSNNPPFVYGATTKFYQDGQFLFNLEENENGYYTKPGFYPSLNRSYKIKVEKPGFDAIYSETTIPTPVNILSFDTLIEIENYEDFYDLDILLLLKYQDPLGVENFYRLDCFQSYIDANGQEVKYKQYITVDDNDEYLFDKSNDYLLWSDLLSDGKEVSIKFRIYMNFYGVQMIGENGSYNYGDSTVITYSILLNSISEDFYKYDKTRSLFFESGGSDNPFAEPVLIYSNIINGYGVFGGYSSDIVSFQYNFQGEYQMIK
ncbi:MAG: DUF4249 domain-containing protein [Bacteroidales bacterium]|nr:DUF4249 domain-containing protein [Bacteroidales bacterium]